MVGIERFNREIIGLPIPSTPTRLSEGRKKHAFDHLHEELTEFFIAETIEDEADALLDLSYVALGRLVEMGILAGAAFDEVQRANMDRVRGGNAKRPNAAGFDAVKPDGWKPPNLAPFMLITKDDVVEMMERRAERSKGLYIGLTRAAAGRRPKPKILVLGYGRHGKDTVAEMLRDHYGLSFTSSSWFCAEKVCMPYFEEKLGIKYESVQACYEDRHNGDNRKHWYDAITEFNRPDASALGRGIYADHDIYCGLRSSREFHAVKAAGLYDLCVWVDASGRGVPPEDKTSCTVEPWMADHVLDNSGDLKELALNLDRLMGTVFGFGKEMR